MTRPESPLLSIVVPVYKEVEVLPELQCRLVSAAEQCGVPWEAVLVDDGSSGETPSLLRALHDSDSRFKILTRSRNFGHQIAEEVKARPLSIEKESRGFKGGRS